MIVYYVSNNRLTEGRDDDDDNEQNAGRTRNIG